VTNLTYGDILILNDYSHIVLFISLQPNYNRRLRVYCNLVVDKV